MMVKPHWDGRSSAFAEVAKTAAMFEAGIDRIDELAGLVRDLGEIDRDAKLTETFPATLERLATEFRTTIDDLQEHLAARRVMA